MTLKAPTAQDHSHSRCALGARAGVERSALISKRAWSHPALLPRRLARSRCRALIDDVIAAVDI
jgi:hypothetical protein